MTRVLHVILSPISLPPAQFSLVAIVYHALNKHLRIHK
jgi:hypothetical protein